MQLSICIVTYNSLEDIGRCLETLFARRPRMDFEVIVVDNASTDGTADWIGERYPAVRLVRSPFNAGFAAASNTAVDISRGEFILLLNPDTEVMPGALDRLIGFLSVRPWVGAAGPMLVYGDGRLQPSCHDLPDLCTAAYGALGLAQLFPRSRVFGRYDMTWWNHATMRRVGWVSGATLAVSRRAWNMVGRLDESFFMYWEDADWQMRLRRAGLECWYVADARVVHYEAASWPQGGRGLMRALIAHWGAFHLYRKHYGRPAEIVLRALVAIGAAGRALGWLGLWLARGMRRTEAHRCGLHAQVAALALGLMELKPTAHRAGEKVPADGSEGDT